MDNEQLKNVFTLRTVLLQPGRVTLLFSDVVYFYFDLLFESSLKRTVGKRSVEGTNSLRRFYQNCD